MQCETCGKTTELFLTEVEGAKLKLCKNCGRYGKVIKRLKTEQEVKREEKQESKKIKKLILGQEKEVMELIVEDYAQKIKDARAKTGLTQEDFARASLIFWA